MNPRGLNRRKKVPPPIPFILTYCNQTLKINKILKLLLLKYYRRTLLWNQAQLVSAIKKNKGLNDLLVHTDLHQ